MKFTASALLANIQQAINSTPPPPRHRKQPVPKSPTARRKTAAKPKLKPASTSTVTAAFPGPATFSFLAAPYLGGTQPSADAYQRFKACAAANPATPWQQLLSSWCASQSEEGVRRTEDGGQRTDGSTNPETETVPESEHPVREACETPNSGGPLVSEITGLLVPRWRHPMLPPASRPLNGREVPVKGTACFARLGDIWHAAEIIGVDANRTLSVIAGNAAHYGLPQHCIRLLVANDLPNQVLPVDFTIPAAGQDAQPVSATSTGATEEDEDDLAGMPDWIRALAEETE